MIMGAGHVQNQWNQFPNWSPKTESIESGRADDVLAWKPSVRKNQWCSVKAVKQEKSLLLEGVSYFCFIQVFIWLDETHPHCGLQSAFLNLLI